MTTEFDIQVTNQAQTTALSTAELTMSDYHQSRYLIDIYRATSQGSYWTRKLREATPKFVHKPKSSSSQWTRKRRDSPQAELLSRRLLPCRKLHLLLKFKDEFSIVHLDSAANFAGLFSLMFVTPTPSDGRSVHSPPLRCSLSCLCVFHLSCTPIQEFAIIFCKCV